MEIGKLIKILAITEDVSLPELADRLGISRQALHQRLKGNMSYRSVKECLGALGYEIYYGKDGEVKKIK